ncbi:hypothetical protein BH10ACT7_BH10ACT7_26500 [soil metagenome]
MRIAFAVGRVALAAAIVAAIVGQLMTSIGFWNENGVTNIAISLTNFFSFFTIESNIATVVVMVIGAVILVTRKGEDPRWFAVLRACVVTYMGVTGIVYNLLLRNIELPQGATLAWSNEVLHVVAPVLVVLDWLFAPGRRPLPWRTLWVVVIFPIVWAVYTLVRGPLTPNELTGAAYWYPYPFLDPNLSQNGYLSVAFYVILIALFICSVGAGALWVSRRKPLITTTD